MKFAFVNDMKIVKIEDTEEQSALAKSHLYQSVINIDEISPEPEVGWVWDYKTFYKNIPMITSRQIRLGLILSGISLDEITSALNTLPEPTKSLAITEWEYSTLFDRKDELVASVGQMLGWTAEQLDDLWILSGSIE